METIWRIESPRLIGGLVRLVRDIDLPEDHARDALVTALERWPTTGIPDNPGAWLMTTAKNRAGRRRSSASDDGWQAQRDHRCRLVPRGRVICPPGRDLRAIRASTSR
jgi:predicted RNA polymerase sigma factor